MPSITVRCAAPPAFALLLVLLAVAPVQAQAPAPPASPAVSGTPPAGTTAPPALAPAPAAPPVDLPPSVALPAELARVLTDYEAAWGRKDAAGLAALFAEDGWVLPFGGVPVRGRAAIEKYYAGNGGPLSLRAIDFAVEGSVGYILGGFARQAGEPDMGKFTLTLRKGADGRWLIVSDMDNPNARRGPG